jgi:hypothetical protein
MERQLQEIESIIADLRIKGLLPLDVANDLRKLLIEEREIDRVCLKLLGRLHAWIDSNQITREDGERYIHLLGISKEEIEYHRSRTIEEDERKRKLN